MMMIFNHININFSASNSANLATTNFWVSSKCVKGTLYRTLIFKYKNSYNVIVLIFKRKKTQLRF